MTGQDIDLTVKPDYIEMDYSEAMALRAQMLGIIDQLERATKTRPRTAQLRKFYKAWKNEGKES